MKLLVLSAALTATLFAFTSKAVAQDRKGFVGLGVGASLPNGDFGSTSRANPYSGFAKAGYLADANFGYRFTDVMGAMVLVRTQINPYSIKAASPGSIEKSRDWLTRSALIGPFVSVPLAAERKIALEARALFGYSRTLRTLKSNAFAWMIGSGMRFTFSDRFSLGLHADYFSSRPTFSFESPAFPDFKRSVKMINTSLTFGYRVF